MYQEYAPLTYLIAFSTLSVNGIWYSSSYEYMGQV